jgi:hypothetical protein
MVTIIDNISVIPYPYDPKYLVSECGKIYGLHYKKWLNPKPNGLGYYMVSILNPRTNNKFIAVHRVVAFTYIENNNPEKKEINHKDGNKANNNVSNLEWCTRGENMRHGYSTNLFENKRKLTSDINRKLFAEGKKRKFVEAGGLARREIRRGNHEQAKKIIHKPTGQIFDCVIDAIEHAPFSKSVMTHVLNKTHKKIDTYEYYKPTQENL